MNKQGNEIRNFYGLNEVVIGRLMFHYDVLVVSILSLMI